MRAGVEMAIRECLCAGYSCDAGTLARATQSVLTLRRYRHPRRLLSRARHGCDPGALRGSLSISRSGLRLCRGRNQAQSLAHFIVQLGHGVFIVFEELAGVLAALADAFALVAEPRPGFF